MKSNRHDINRIDVKAAYAKLRIQQNANLFQLNSISTGEFITTHFATVTRTQYFDNSGNIIFDYEETAPDWRGMSWISDNVIVFGANENLKKLEFDRGTGSFDISTIYDGSLYTILDHFDVDEQGFFYLPLNTSTDSLLKVSPDGDVVASSSGFSSNRGVHVDGEHVYSWDSSKRRYRKRSKEDLTIFFSGPEAPQSHTDAYTSLIYTDHILHLFSHSTTNSIVLIKKDDLAIHKTVLPATFGRGNFLKMVYDETGTVYVITSQWLLKFDKDLNLISEHDLGVSGASKIAVSPAPYNEIAIRYEDSQDPIVRKFDRHTIAFKAQFTSIGSSVGSQKSLAAHPGRFFIKFKVLGLTKQF